MAIMKTKSTKLGPWTVRQRLAVTVSSEVFLARKDRQVVALKAPRNPRGREALLHEAELLRNLSHPGLPRLIDAEARGDWVAVEYIPGMHIVDWASERPLEQVVRTLGLLLDAIEYLHQQGLVHGDLTPSNVLVREDQRPVLLDLGLAGVPETDTNTSFRGSLGYVAPEVLQGQSPSPASDLYGFGAVAFTALCGQPPFTPQDPAALVYLPTVTVPLPPSSRRHAIPQAIDDVVLDLLARDPRARISNFDAIRSRLQRSQDLQHQQSVVGMESVRDQLRRIAMEVLDGQDRTVVLYGPPGSGKATLIEELLAVAQREGASRVSPTDTAALAAANTPTVVPVCKATPWTPALSEAVQSVPGPTLLLVCSERPIPELRKAGAVEITPPPMGRLDAIRLAHTWGVRDETAEQWWRESFGHPRSFHGYIRAWLRKHGRQIGHEHLNDIERAILKVLEDGETHALPDVARAMTMGEHRLLDHCEALLAERLIESTHEGASLRLVQ
jgi:predicted Ser/Thr protein kinase/energy-coupling factor transporter ATP-binding protein EcfA2